MRRIKRFVLVQSDEKDPMWKSSDNLFAEMVRKNSDVTSNDGSTCSKDSEQITVLSGSSQSSSSVATSSTSGLQ